jgi:hypothetical protein
MTLSLVLLFFLLTESDKFSDVIFLAYPVFIFLFTLGIFGLNKISNRYKIISITNKKPLVDKEEAVGNIVENFDSTRKLLNENAVSFNYQKNFWSSSYDISLFFDEAKVCFSIQARSTGGFLDFGGTERLRQQVKDEIELQLS